MNVDTGSSTETAYSSAAGHAEGSAMAMAPNSVVTAEQHSSEGARAEEVLDAVAAFFDSWFPRLEALLTRCDAVARQTAAVEQQRAALEEDKQQWEQQREEEAQQFQDVVHQLSAAWLRLEAEQRELLQTRAAAAVATTSGTPESDRGGGSAVAAHPHGMEVSPGSVPPPLPVDVSPVSAPPFSQQTNQSINRDYQAGG